LLTKWTRFWKLDVPSGMIPLVWNGMMSFGGAWFFLAASESISVLNHTYALPGIGSYVAAAITQSSLSHVGIAIGVMIILVIGVNFLFWRPMVAWAERFRTEESPAAERPRSVVLDVLRRSSVPDLVSRPARPVGRALDKITAERVPLIKAIVKALHATADGTPREGFFLDLLRRGFTAEEARRQLDTAIEWGRYGELFEYDSESGQLILGSDPARVGV
jgi:ABC-type anion transport system duplicated permease subunit